MRLNIIELEIIDFKTINEGVIYLQLWFHFQFQTDIIISKMLSIGFILTSHVLICGEMRNYLSKSGHFYNNKTNSTAQLLIAAPIGNWFLHPK